MAFRSGVAWTLVAAAVIATGCTREAGVGTAAPGFTGGGRLSQGTAYQRLRSHGIALRSSGSCTDREQGHCTSLDGLRRSSVAGLVRFRQQSGCRLTVSGGTEQGHAQGVYSHANGFKMDVLPNRCVNGYIEHHFQYVGERSDGASTYRAPTGFTYSDEHGTHWDIVFAPTRKARG